MIPQALVKVALDIDGSITEHPAFMAALSQAPGTEIHILTGRGPEDHEATVRELATLGIRYSKIHYADTWADKGALCESLRIEILVEDQDEYIRHIPERVLVLKPRNGGNYDFLKRVWG